VKAALETFEARSFAAAADAFAALGRRATGTGREPGYALLRHHAETLADAPPSTGWCGEIALEHK
jgi:hypothetical protein